MNPGTVAPDFMFLNTIKMMSEWMTRKEYKVPSRFVHIWKI